MLTLFNVIVFVHIVCAILWIGTAVVLEILEWEAIHATKRERLATTLRRSSWFGMRVFAPAAILTLLTGVLAVVVGPPSFGQLWVIIALVAVLVVSVLGGAVIGRGSAQLGARLNDPGVSEDEIERGLMRIRSVMYLDLSILFFILFDMVMRPTKFDAGFFTVSGVYFVAVIAGIIIWQIRHAHGSEIPPAAQR